MITLGWIPATHFTDLQCPLCHRTLFLCTDHCIVCDHIGLQFILLHIIQEPQALLVIEPFFFACADHCSRLHWDGVPSAASVKDLQGPLCYRALPACTDHCAVSDHIGLECILLHLIKDLPSPLCHAALPACTDHCIVREQSGLDGQTTACT